MCSFIMKSTVNEKLVHKINQLMTIRWKLTLSSLYLNTHISVILINQWISTWRVWSLGRCRRIVMRVWDFVKDLQMIKTTVNFQTFYRSPIFNVFMYRSCRSKNNFNFIFPIFLLIIHYGGGVWVWHGCLKGAA